MKSSGKAQPGAKGLLLQYHSRITGQADACLSLKKLPLILRPMKKFNHNLVQSLHTGEACAAPDFLFKNVKFACADLTNLFVIQNRSANLKIVFEHCFFVNEK